MAAKLLSLLQAMQRLRGCIDVALVPGKLRESRLTVGLQALESLKWWR